MVETALSYSEILMGEVQGAVLAGVHVTMKVVVGGENLTPQDVAWEILLGAFGGAVGAGAIGISKVFTGGQPSTLGLIGAGIFTAFIVGSAAVVGALVMTGQTPDDTGSSSIFTTIATAYEASPSLPVKAAGFFVDICANLLPH